jgi:hypothetical protein
MNALTNDKENDHSKELEVLIETRDMFNNLEDRLLKGEEIDTKDYILLYAGAMVSRNIIQKNINTWTAVVKEYDENLIPKLTEVAKETDENKRSVLIDEFFS